MIEKRKAFLFTSLIIFALPISSIPVISLCMDFDGGPPRSPVVTHHLSKRESFIGSNQIMITEIKEFLATQNKSIDSYIETLSLIQDRSIINPKNKEELHLIANQLLQAMVADSVIALQPTHNEESIRPFLDFFRSAIGEESIFRQGPRELHPESKEVLLNLRKALVQDNVRNVLTPQDLGLLYSSK